MNVTFYSILVFVSKVAVFFLILRLLIISKWKKRSAFCIISELFFFLIRLFWFLFFIVMSLFQCPVILSCLFTFKTEVLIVWEGLVISGVGGKPTFFIEKPLHVSIWRTFLLGQFPSGNSWEFAAGYKPVSNVLMLSGKGLRETFHLVQTCT